MGIGDPYSLLLFFCAFPVGGAYVNVFSPSRIGTYRCWSRGKLGDIVFWWALMRICVKFEGNNWTGAGLDGGRISVIIG